MRNGVACFVVEATRGQGYMVDVAWMLLAVNENQINGAVIGCDALVSDQPG